MKAQEWIKLIEDNKESIINKCEEAYAEAMKDNELQYHVNLYDDGDLSTWYTNAGSNSFSSSVFNGKAIELMRFDFQNYSPELSDTDLEAVLHQNGYTKQWRALKNGISLWCPTRRVSTPELPSGGLW